jgi:hypothetical protein
VCHGAELVALTVYRRGAAEVARRLNAAAAAAVLLQGAAMPAPQDAAALRQHPAD